MLPHMPNLNTALKFGDLILKVSSAKSSIRGWMIDSPDKTTSQEQIQDLAERMNNRDDSFVKSAKRGAEGAVSPSFLTGEQC